MRISLLILFVRSAAPFQPHCTLLKPNPHRTMSDSSDSNLSKAERRISSLLLNSGQPQEGSLKTADENDGYRHVRDVFSDGAPQQRQQQQQQQKQYAAPSEFRMAVRQQRHVTPTNGVCPGYMQANLIVLEEKYAFDFLLFCQKNKQACPLIEVLDVGSVEANCGVGSDLRVDVPK